MVRSDGYPSLIHYRRQDLLCLFETLHMADDDNGGDDDGYDNNDDGDGD